MAVSRRTRGSVSGRGLCLNYRVRGFGHPVLRKAASAMPDTCPPCFTARRPLLAAATVGVALGAGATTASADILPTMDGGHRLGRTDPQAAVRTLTGTVAGLEPNPPRGHRRRPARQQRRHPGRGLQAGRLEDADRSGGPGPVDWERPGGCRGPSGGSAEVGDQDADHVFLGDVDDLDGHFCSSPSRLRTSAVGMPGSRVPSALRR